MKCPNCGSEMIDLSEYIDENQFGCPNCKTTLIQSETNYITKDMEELYNTCKEKVDEIIETINASGTKH